MNQTEDITPISRVVVDGDLSAERLLVLIGLCVEEERLDYKNEYNLSGSKNTKDKVELVRDIVAMANTYGGYIVLGVHEITDSTGKRFVPNGMSQQACASLDVSKLRQQVEAYVSERIEIQFKLYTLEEYEGNTFGVIYISHSLHLPIIFSRDGQYADKNGQINNNVTLFYSGDIVVRKGASTERADQSDIRRITSEIRQREKARWTEEILGMRDLVQRLDQLITLLGGNQIAPIGRPEGLVTKSLGVFDESLLYLSPSVILENIPILIENGRNATVQRYISNAPGLFFQHVETLDASDENVVLETRDNRLWPILDGLLAIGISCIEYKQWDLFHTVQQALYRICHQAEKSNPKVLSDIQSPINTYWIWQEVILRVYTLGGLLVYRNHWSQVKQLVQQEIEWDQYYRSHYWSRYILIQSSRAGLLEKQGWIPLVVSYVEKQNWILALFMSDKDQVLNSICQFDFLQCIYTAINDESEIDPTRPYPSFGLYYKTRTEPIVAKLVVPGELRETISEISDDNLAKLITDIDVIAQRAFIMYSGWEVGNWSNKKIQRFLADHPTPK